MFYNHEGDEMKFETIEARAIPALKIIGSKIRKDGQNEMNAHCDKVDAKLRKAVGKRLAGVVASEWQLGAKVSADCYRITLRNKGVEIRVDYPDARDKFDPLYHDRNDACTRAAKVFSMTTNTTKLRYLAAYVRTNTGNTKKALSMSSSQFMALVKRYVEDLFADNSCQL